MLHNHAQNASNSCLLQGAQAAFTPLIQLQVGLIPS